MPGYFLQTTPGLLTIEVRHGETELNEEKRVRAWMDVPLSDEGRLVIQLLGHKLEKYEPKAIYHSDLMRDTETAHILGQILRISPETEFGLRTWDVGVLEGEKDEDALPIIRRYMERPWETPEGSSESFNKFSARVMDCIERLWNLAANEPFRPIIMVSHGRPLALVQSFLEGRPMWECKMPTPGGCAFVSVGDDGMLNYEIQGKSEGVSS